MTKALDQYITSLIPSGPDRKKVSERKSRIKQALTDAGISPLGMYESGSFTHGTAIANKSDVDCLVWLSYKYQPERPSTILRKVKESLHYSDWEIVSVNVSSPTVQVRYLSPPHFEVVPGFLDGYTEGEPAVYQIPGRADEWVKSSPASHNKYVSDVNDALGKKAKPLIRLMKAWKYGHSVPVSSFYLEMRTAKYLSTQEKVTYSVDLEAAMRTILGANVADLNDPANAKVGRIPACSSEADRQTTRRALDLAVTNLSEAFGYSIEGKWIDYYLTMRKVYPDFPYAEGW